MLTLLRCPLAPELASPSHQTRQMFSWHMVQRHLYQPIHGTLVLVQNMPTPRHCQQAQAVQFLIPKGEL